MPVLRLRKIVSGGQTGVDRAALDWAMIRGLDVGGWCPAGRLAEDGTIPTRYPLKETDESAYIVRTQGNVRDSDATLILSLSETLNGGSAATRDLAISLGHPWLHLSRANAALTESVGKLRDFLLGHDVEILNVAGPRASEEPEAGEFVTALLDQTFPSPFPT
ncbi:MAG: putative molybdenum carrier protein [Verrucomicrobiae bacterium]|nr:putative molybdenum carrier protein [Verrucomicrobiae bacterium]